MSSVNQISDKKYAQYNDYYFKSVLLERANGLLKFIGIPYEIVSIMLSEFTNVGPGISRIDFAGDVKRTIKILVLFWNVSPNFQQRRILRDSSNMWLH